MLEVPAPFEVLRKNASATNKKKLHIPDISSKRWKELFDQNVGAKWRERRVRYEQQKTDAKMDSIDLEPATPTPVADSDDARGKVENKYEDIVHSSSGVLLLPSVPPLSEEQSSSLIAKVLTGVEQQSIIQEARNDRDRAIMEAKSYRDLAEKIKKEKREQECNLLKQTEAVRDFWRNKVLEGDTRGGKILRASLSSGRH